MATDPAVIGWLGDLAHTYHAWGGRVGSLLVVLVGLFIVRRHRPLHSEELWSFIAVLVWIAGDIVIAGVIPEQNAALRWGGRALLFLILTSDYVALRGRPGTVIVEETETLIVEERERERA
jgi:hypothetical protein